MEEPRVDRRRWRAEARPLLLAAVVVLASGTTPSWGAVPQVAGEPAASLPAGEEIPTPEAFIGWEPGTDRKLADYDQISGYFQALAAASDRIHLEEIGTSAQGRPLVLATISSRENLQERERWRDISRRLALGEETDSLEARRLAREGRVVLWMDGGLHSTEVAGAQFMPTFAHRLVTEESEEFQRIREQVLLLLMPVMNPDGLDIVAGWYRSHVGTEFETAPLPRLYHEYVGHDNNRDWFMLLMPESRAVARQLWHVWYPQIVVNHHQTGGLSPGRIFIPPFADPVNPHIPPLVVAGNNLIGTAIMRRFVEEGKPGAISRHQFTQWWNGGMRTAPYFHNQIGILTEVAVDDYATPTFHHPDSLPRVHRGSGIPGDRASTWYPLPWKGGWWRPSDQVEYMLTASMAVADVAARYREDWLFGAWRMARQAIEAGERGAPYAYLVSVDEQHDPGTAVAMLETLRRGGAELYRAARAFRAGGREWRAGTYVLPAAQPYRALLLDLLEPQRHPDRRLFPGGPPEPPYDLAGWTLPIQMGVEVVRVDEPFAARLERMDGWQLPDAPGGVEGRGPLYLLDAGANASFHAANLLLSGAGLADPGASEVATGEVRRATAPFEAAGRRWPAGTFLVRAEGADRLREVAARAGVTFTGAGTGSLEVASRRLEAPRVGLYRSWVANIDEGWTRWLLERHGFRVETLRDADIRASDLSRFHAIILPHQPSDQLLNGHPPGTMPEAYVGGMGVEGAARLKAFVEGGGRLVALDAASEFAIRQLGLPVRDAVSGLDSDRFFIPGSLIRLEVDPERSVAWGMRSEAAAFFVRSRAFRIVPPVGGDGRGAGRDVEVVARYAEDDLLLSGWEMGARESLGGLPAVLQVPLGSGSVVLIGFRAQFRAQPHGTFKLLFNSLLEGASEAVGAAGAPGSAELERR